MSLIWQQGGDLYEGDTATVNTPEAKAALKVLTDLFDNGYAKPKLNYADSQQAFLNGEGAIFINGTWGGRLQRRTGCRPGCCSQKLLCCQFPNPVRHRCLLGRQPHVGDPGLCKKNAPEKYQAALKVLAFINDHNGDWARTGHMAVRKSVLESDAYAKLPHRTEYAGTAAMARTMPPNKHYGAIWDALNREYKAIWLTGKDVDEALSNAQTDVQDLLDR